MPRNKMSFGGDSLLTTHLVGGFLTLKKRENDKESNLILEIPPLDWLPSMQRMYGGSIAANIFLAASQIAKPKQYPLTLQVDYLLMGDYSKPQTFEVSCLRSSDRFTHASVVLRQGGDIVAAGKATFHIQEDRAYAPYSVKFPRSVAKPKDISHTIELWNGHLNDSADRELTRRMYEFWCAGTRLFGLQSLLASTRFTKTTSQICHWVRFRNNEIYDLETKFGIHWSAALLAYATDFHPMLTIISQQPDYGGNSQVCSLAHALWFSSDPEIRLRRPTEEWFLIETIVVMLGNNIGVCEARVWTEDRKLLALVKHHGLTRPRL